MCVKIFSIYVRWFCIDFLVDSIMMIFFVYWKIKEFEV